MLAKIVRNELGYGEGWSFLTKMTTYYLTHSLLSFFAGVSKDNRDELGNREGWSIFDEIDHPSLLPNSFLIVFLSRCQQR